MLVSEVSVPTLKRRGAETRRQPVPLPSPISAMSNQTAIRGVIHTAGLEKNYRARAVHETSVAEDMQCDAPVTLTREVTTYRLKGAPHLMVEHLGATIGSVVHGVDMAATSPSEATALRALLLERKVIFFREQHITEQQHIDFSRQFGPLEIHPFNPMHPEHDEIIPIYSGAKYVGSTNRWHSDVMWRMEPSLGSLLRARVVPAPSGGDTLFADMYAAYNGLPADLKEQIDGLFAVNSGAANGSKEKARTRLAERGASQEELDAFDRRYASIPIPVHPVVRTHPETGKKALYVNRSFTRSIVGMEDSESKQLLETLYRQADTPEYQCRFKWEVGSVAFWDNRACQHYGSSDYWPQRRRMERVTVAGDRPYYEDSKTRERQYSYALEERAQE